MLLFRRQVGPLYISKSQLSEPQAIGDGEQAVVERARLLHRSGDPAETVAVKSYLPGLVRSTQDLSELVLEASKLAKLQHEHIAAFKGMGCYSASTNEAVRATLFYVEEYVGSRTLRSLVQEQMRAPQTPLYAVADALRWAQQLAQAMAYLHSRHPPITHSDIKLDNVFLTDGPLDQAVVKIADLKPHKHLMPTLDTATARSTPRGCSDGAPVGGGRVAGSGAGMSLARYLELLSERQAAAADVVAAPGSAGAAAGNVASETGTDSSSGSLDFQVNSAEGQNVFQYDDSSAGSLQPLAASLQRSPSSQAELSHMNVEGSAHGAALAAQAMACPPQQQGPGSPDQAGTPPRGSPTGAPGSPTLEPASSSEFMRSRERRSSKESPFAFPGAAVSLSWPSNVVALSLGEQSSLESYGAWAGQQAGNRLAAQRSVSMTHGRSGASQPKSPTKNSGSGSGRRSLQLSSSSPAGGALGGGLTRSRSAPQQALLPINIGYAGSGNATSPIKAGGVSRLEIKQHGSMQALTALTECHSIEEEPPAAFASRGALASSSAPHGGRGELEAGMEAGTSDSYRALDVYTSSPSSSSLLQPGMWPGGSGSSQPSSLVSTPDATTAPWLLARAGSIEQETAAAALAAASLQQALDAVPSSTWSLIHAAPERLQGHKVTEKVDVFAYGVLLYELLSRQLLVPWAASAPEDEGQARQAIERYAYAVAMMGARPPLPASWPPPVCELIRACWAQDPHERPRMSDVAARLQELEADR